MSIRRYLSVTLQLLVVLVIIALFAGQALGQPILLSFVETGSMEPTLEPGDGFVAIPAELAGEPKEGDVVTFDAQELHGGGLTTHRIVGETERGYITHGDANSFTDQDGSEPPVQDAQITAKALQINGEVVVIPHLGTVVQGTQSGLETVQSQLAATFGTQSLLGTQGIAYLLLALSGVAYVVDWWLTRGRDRDRTHSRERDTGTSMRLVILAFAGIVMLSATMAMVAPAGTEEFGVVSSSFESDRPTVIQTGTTETIEYLVPNSGLIPTYAYLEPGSDGVDVEPDRVLVDSRSQKNATVALTAPPETGYYPMYVVEYRYLAILPGSTIDALYQRHPWLPIVTINAILGGSIYALGITTVGTGRARIRRRTRTRDGPSEWA